MKLSQGVFAGALVMLVAACGGNTRSSSTPPRGTGSPASLSSASATTSAPDLTAELLALRDLPAGYSVVANSDRGEPGCLDHLRSDLRAESKAEATFLGGSSGLPVLEESLFYVPAHGQGAMSVVAQTVSNCGLISMTTGGQTLKGTLRSTPFPAFANQSSAYQTKLSGTRSGQSVTVVIDLVVFRKGDTVAMILYGNLGLAGIQALQPLVQNAAGKLS